MDKNSFNNNFVNSGDQEKHLICITDTEFISEISAATI